MKKILFTLLICLCMIPGVNADTLIFDSVYYQDIYIKNKDTLKEQANLLVDHYNTNLKNEYEYYFITYSSFTGGINHTGLSMIVTNSINFRSYKPVNADFGGYGFMYNTALVFGFDNNQIITLLEDYINSDSIFEFNLDSTPKGSFHFIYDSNFSILYNKNLINQVEELNDLSIDTLEIKNFYSDSSIIINHNENIPLLKNLLEHDNFIDYEASQNGYIEVNLDNYKYVILNLKDYSKKEAFETNLQVKGSIAITPLYEFGTAEKETNTNLCNTSYADFTNYRFFVLKNDLLNNAVYIVKNCQNTNSSFRYDSSIFDITYVTSENVNDPVITFDGKDYHTIPFNKITNTTNKNEEEGFIPGASEQFDPFSDITDYILSFWNSLTTFMGLVTKFFNTLPIEIRAISITMFTTAITLGVIKFIKS